MNATYTGVVQRGKRRGAELGFPTANIAQIDGVSGIFAATISVSGRKYPAAVFADPERKLLEAHVLDFSGDLYGKEITIRLLKRIRDSKTFENDDALRSTIMDDIEKIRAYFSTV